jgi:PAS domain S-box-containing protein
VGASILIVEDEGIVAMELARRVESMGHRVVGPVGTAADALRAVEQDGSVDLAVLDVRLRGEMTGTDLAEQLRARYQIPFVFLTAYSDEDTLQRIKHCEPLGYLLKPLDGRSLWVTLETALYTHEVTQRRAEAERARQRSDALYAGILDHSHDGIVSVNESGRITVFNKGAELIFGYAAEDVRGEPLSLLLPERQHAAHIAHVQRYLSQETTARCMGEYLEVTGRRRDGSSFPAEVSISQVRLESEVVATAFVRDVSARQALETRVAQAERFEALGRLAGGIAHDFNNLLTGVVGYAKLLHRSFSAEDPRRRDVQEIQVAGERAGRLVKELLAYSSRQTMLRERVEINDALRRLQNMLRTLLGNDVHLCLALEESLPDVMGDPGKLEQVFMNLVLNARDAMPAGGVVTVETRRATAEETNGLVTTGGQRCAIVVSVRDEGVGMDDQTQRRIFEPFFTTKRDSGGTGLGLATSFGTVRQSGGTILVDSAPGGGSTFRVVLPAEETPDLPRAQLRDAAIAPATPRRTVLIADDESLIRDLGARLLRDDGYEVLTATDGEEAWHLVLDRSDTIDLLLTDVVMPRMDGFELARRWIERNPRSPVLLMTAYADQALHLNDAMRNHATLLEKPFSPDDLSRLVAELLG